MVQMAKEYFEVFVFFCATTSLVFLFLILTPISKDPHGFLMTNEISDFSNTSLIKWALFGSAALCAVLGTLLMSWITVLTAGIVSNLLSMTYFLLWADSIFGLSIQFQTFDFLKCFGTGLLFICLFLFTIGYVDSNYKKMSKVAGWKEKAIHYWFIGWICFYFWISVVLVFKTVKDFEPHFLLVFCFLGGCFLNYLFFLFLKKESGNKIGIFSRMGRVIFGCWILIIVLLEIGQVWLR